MIENHPRILLVMVRLGANEGQARGSDSTHKLDQLDMSQSKKKST